MCCKSVDMHHDASFSGAVHEDRVLPEICVHWFLKSLINKMLL